jgi:hypothetical protein
MRQVEVWVDESEIAVGDSIRRRIDEGIASSDRLIAVLSIAAVSSTWVNAKLDAALARSLADRTSFLLPVMREKVELPPLLRGIKYADFSSDYDSGLAQLLSALGCEAPSRPHFVTGKVSSLTDLMTRIGATSTISSRAVFGLVDLVEGFGFTEQERKVAASFLAPFVQLALNAKCWQIRAGGALLAGALRDLIAVPLLKEHLKDDGGEEHEWGSGDSSTFYYRVREQAVIALVKIDPITYAHLVESVEIDDEGSTLRSPRSSLDLEQDIERLRAITWVRVEHP